MRVFLGLVLAGLLLAGCGNQTAPDPTSAPTASPTASPTAEISPTAAPAYSALYRRAERLLESIGVTGVAQLEPPDGSPAESLSGTWHGHEVLVGVTPTHQADFDEVILREYVVRDRAARVFEAPPYTFHRVNLGPFLWDVAVSHDDAETKALVKALVDSQLPPEGSPAEMVAQAAHLYGARVRRTGDDYAVTSVWGVFCEHGGGCDPAVRVDQVGGERSYQVGSWDELRSALRVDQQVTSLAPDVTARIGGPDGATPRPYEPIPFELVSRNGGAPETVREPQGMQTAGAVVLSDGRLLALLTTGDNLYDLWVSEDDDWTTYRPLPTPADVTGLPTTLAASLDPDPVLWLETSGGNVFVSTDDAVTFRQLHLR